MSGGDRLFKPTDSLAIRDPLSNEKENGNIFNPPRMAQLGGWSSTDKGITKNPFKIVRPGASTRRIPMS
jgi:hypothetical protein